MKYQINWKKLFKFNIWGMVNKYTLNNTYEIDNKKTFIVYTATLIHFQ